MQPDDAADLLSELPDETAEQLLQLMEPDEAEPLRRLLTYDEKTAGGLMTTEPVILAPESTIAEALAVVRRAELDPGAGQRGLRLPPAAGDADRALHRAGPHPAAAARAARGRRRRGHRQRRRAAVARRAARPGHPAAGDVQPGHGAGRRRRGAPARRGHRRRRARPHPPGRLARHRRPRGHDEPTTTTATAGRGR